MRKTDSTRGQSAVFDATMFLAILLVASTMMVSFSASLRQAEDVSSFQDLHTHATRLTNVVLASTVPNASYVDIHGNHMVRTDISVQDVIIEELVLLHDGVPEENFRGHNRYNDRLGQVLSSLVDDDRFSYALSCSYGEKEIVIGDVRPTYSMGIETSAHTTEISLPGEGERITITLFLWRD